MKTKIPSRRVRSGTRGTQQHALVPFATVLLITACSDPITAPPPPPLIPGEPRVLALPTYDGSGQAVHPDVVVFNEGWRGATHWMAVTPYPFGNARYENPSLLASQDGIVWTPPAGVVNPIVLPPASGYNSDPDLVHDPIGDRLILIWREVVGENVLRSAASTDGRNWSKPTTLLRVPNHQALSPAVVLRGNIPMLWYVDAGAPGCAARSSTVRLRRGSHAGALLPSMPSEGWTADVATTLAIPGRVVWHLDVAYVSWLGEYWAIIHAFSIGAGCGSGDLYVARSRDAVNWAADDAPLLRASAFPWSSASLYRTSVVPDERRQLLRLWLSGRALDGSWSVAYLELGINAVQAEL